MLRIYFELYRPATITSAMGEKSGDDFACEQKRPELRQVSELIVLKCLTGCEDLAWMNQEQAIAINRILVK